MATITLYLTPHEKDALIHLLKREIKDIEWVMNNLKKESVNLREKFEDNVFDLKTILNQIEG